MGAEQRLDPLAQVGIARTGLVEIARPLLRRKVLDRVQENVPGSGNVDSHGRLLCFPSTQDTKSVINLLETRHD